MPNSLQSYDLQHTRLPSPSLSPGVCSDPCPLRWWCYLTISSSAALSSICLQSFLVSGLFTNELILCIKWPKHWSFSISPSSEHSGWISFRIDLFDLLAVQETLNSLLQHNSKVLVLQCSPSLWSNSYIHIWLLQKSFVVQSLVLSDSLQPHELQYARLLCPLLPQNLLKLTSVELVIPSNHLILCHPLLL